MHMSDALVSPAVGGVMWCVSAGALALASRVADGSRERLVPAMGVLGAFVFAAQMINFSIPLTGSSGHLGGGLLLAVILGPWAALLTIASVLVVQALFFADGGLLALGCNIFNMGVLPCLLICPFVYAPLAGKEASPFRLGLAAVLSSVLALQAGAFAVVLETLCSGVTALPFRSFLFLMQLIHLPIGVVEGLATALLLLALRRRGGALVQALPVAAVREESGEVSSAAGLGRKLAVLSMAALVMGGVAAWFASPLPDGLEWSVSGVADGEAEVGVHSEWTSKAASLQRVLSPMPGYAFRTDGIAEAEEPPSWPGVDLGTTAAGVAGSVLVALLIGGVALMLRPGKEGRIVGGERR